MSTEYSDLRIKEILSKVNGQGKLAEQAVIALTQRDAMFLQSLVTPFLGGIIAHSIERNRKQSGIAVPPPIRQSPLPKVAVKKPAASAKQLPTTSMDEMMKAWAKKFEQTENAEPVPAGQKVSQSHLDAMKALAVKNLGGKKS